MKKILFIAIFMVSALGLSAQTGEVAVIGSVGYQTEYDRFGLSGQGRYNIADAWRVAADVSFFFPKDKITGLDIDLNLHYVFKIGNNNKMSFYPLAGFGMQNNFYGKQKATVNGVEVEVDSDSKTKLGVNLGAGFTYNLTAKSFLNVEGKFMFGDKDSAVFWVGYGYKF